MGLHSVVLGHVSLKRVLFLGYPTFGLVFLGHFARVSFIHLVTSGSLFYTLNASFLLLVISARLSVVLRPLRLLPFNFVYTL